jgi:Uma2 family endonuclease
MKLQIADDTILYPDVFITCDRDDLCTDQVFRAPTVVIEVLSPSTQAYDRSKKFAWYRRLASLKEYVLVDPDTRRVESFRLGPGGLWTLHDMSENPAMDLAFPPCTLAMEDLFAGVDPPDHGVRPSGEQAAPDRPTPPTG